MLPLFVVPLVISTHLWIFAWSARPVEPLPQGPVVLPPEDIEVGEENEDEGSDPETSRRSL
jgi:hypothetical protein